MLSSITPLGERGRDNRWWRTATAYIVGSIAGGAAMGAVLGAIGALIRQVTADADPALPLALLALVATLGLLADLRVGGLRVPSNRRQVDEQWIGAFRGWVYGIAFGFQLGLGAVTIVTSAATWVTLAAAALAALAGSWSAGLAVGVAFGAARAMPILLALPVRSPGSLRDLHLRHQRLAPLARHAATGGQGVVALVALLSLLVTT